MSERYLPSSDFLKEVIAERIPLSGDGAATADLRQLIAMTRDADPTNRDWATLLLAQQDLNTPEVKDALLHAARDIDQAVRAEAILGLAQRDGSLALPLVQLELKAAGVMPPIFEAAALLADPSLVDDLQCFVEPSGNAHADSIAQEALHACTRGRSHS